MIIMGFIARRHGSQSSLWWHDSLHAFAQSYFLRVPIHVDSSFTCAIPSFDTVIQGTPTFELLTVRGKSEKM